MGETVRPGDGGPQGFDAVTATGTVLAGVTTAGLLYPLRQGIEEPVVTVGVALAILSVAAFLARRYGAVPRTVGAPIAAAVSLGVFLLAGYALNLGVVGAVALPVVSWSFPLVFAAFLAAGGAVGMAIADYVGLTGRGVKRRVALTASLSVVGVVGLLSTYVFAFVLSVPAFLLLGEFTQVQLTAITQLSMAFGTATVAAGYLHLKGYDRSFVDLKLPTKWDVLWSIAGIVVLFGTLFVISMVLYSTGVETAEHGTAEQAQQNPDILLVLIPAAILIIGPFEELLYRNVIQKSLYERFSRAGAIVVGSVIFAAVHALAYGTAGVGAVVVSLGVVFGLSLVLGTIYERTGNLLVPALVHGVYNAILFASLYFGAI